MGMEKEEVEIELSKRAAEAKKKICPLLKDHCVAEKCMFWATHQDFDHAWASCTILDFVQNVPMGVDDIGKQIADK